MALLARTTRAAVLDVLNADFVRTARSKGMSEGRVVKWHVLRNALGTHTTVSRVQGTRLKAKREIRVASLFREAPEPFLKMIVVHELAHLKERQHDKAFYALCQHMEPGYHQLEFDVRLWLTAREFEASGAAR